MQSAIKAGNKLRGYFEFSATNDEEEKEMFKQLLQVIHTKTSVELDPKIFFIKVTDGFFPAFNCIRTVDSEESMLVVEYSYAFADLQRTEEFKLQFNISENINFYLFERAPKGRKSRKTGI